MSESRTIIRVFLASPGDLADERNAAKEAVDEVNTTIAIPQGYQIDLYGWEDTTSTAGRPQAIINEELKLCELFIGMLWKRWGTPPDNEGLFSSGFEEEFTLATELRDKKGAPQIQMYFKAVDSDMLKDPGPDLSKVLIFKNSLIAEKKFLYKDFDNTADYSSKLRIGLAEYINKKRQEAASSERGMENSSTIEQTDKAIEPSLEVVNTTPLVQAEFLESFAARLREPATADSISAVEIARLRLAAFARSVPGNDDPDMGAHDANLIYRNKNEFEFENMEIRRLAEFGLAAIRTQTKPLWSWLAKSLHDNNDLLLFETWSDTGSVRRGAFEAARLGHFSVLDSEILARDRIVEYWLSRTDVEAQKDALKYLQEFGNDEDCKLVEHRFEDAPGTTSGDYLATILAIRQRYDLTYASRLLVSSAFDNLDAAVLQGALNGVSQLSPDDLNLAIEHRNADVRQRGLVELAARKLASGEIGRRFADDADLRIRQTALDIIENHEGELSLSDVEKVLVKHKSPRSGLLGALAGSFDLAGYRAYEKAKTERMARHSPLHLRSLITNADVDSDLAYFALVKRDFNMMVKSLRFNFDDRFVQFFEKDVEFSARRFGTLQSSLEVIEKIRANSALTRKKYMRKALDLLESQSESQDLLRIREAIDDESVAVKALDCAYLSKHGDWSDIDRLAKMATMRADEPVSLLGIGHSLLEDAANAIYALGHDRFTELVSLDLSWDLMGRICSKANQAQFRSLSDVEIARLMLVENDELRKVVALKSVVSLGVRRCRKLLESHLQGERYFYNIVHWLDLAVAFPQDQARAIAKRALVK